jgi:hypothetical protein
VYSQNAPGTTTSNFTSAKPEAIAHAMGERAFEHLLRFGEHSGARVAAEDAARGTDDAHRAARDRARAGGHVEHPHAGLHARTLHAEAAIPQPALEEEGVDGVVVRRQRPAGSL